MSRTASAAGDYAVKWVERAAGHLPVWRPRNLRKGQFMTLSIKALYGHKLEAADGEIGHVKDFYFDDESWAVRYVVVDTGSWLPGRQVLLSPHAFGSLAPAGKTLVVNLTRKQVENSPAIELHKPVSRQYEEEYYRHYGWPFYWEGGDIWGASPFPVAPAPGNPSAESGGHKDGADAHLRSTQAVNGYHLQAGDGTAGHVCDFMMDAKSWAITHLVIKTGHRLSGKEVQIPSSEVGQISYDESTVFVSLTKDAIERIPAISLEPAGAAN
jgi:hypothetical protein